VFGGDCRVILSEDDVRAYVREASGGKARWIEPALGSTPGLPDCWVPKGKGIGQVHLELKCGQIKNGRLRFKVRPEQKKEIKRMIQDGVVVGFLVGIQDTHNCVFMAVTGDSLGGNVGLSGDDTPKYFADVREIRHYGFWLGVNFIFSDCGEKL